jgi:hypothetical protein
LIIAMTDEHQVIETFEISGRGAVAVIADVTERRPGRPYRAEVVDPAGTIVAAEAYKEFLLRHQPIPAEREAYWLKGLHKTDVPPGSCLRFIE